MSNLLFDHPEEWKDWDGYQPPAAWDAETKTYVFPIASILTYQGVAADGDTISISASQPSHTYNGDVVSVYETGLPYQDYGEIPYAGDFPATLDIQLPAGAVPAVSVDPAGGHAIDVTLSAPLIAPNESLTTVSGKSVSVMPDITQGGDSVTPDGLEVSAAPGHGSAATSGVTLTYTPAPGFQGTDSFLYYAKKGDLKSNEATVTVNVTFSCSGPILEVWQPPSSAYNLRIRAYALPKPFEEDTDTTTVDAELVFLLALANAKAHYGQPDARQYFDQLQLRMRKMRARLHNDARYTIEKPWRPPPMPKIKGIDD